MPISTASGHRSARESPPRYPVRLRDSCITVNLRLPSRHQLVNKAPTPPHAPPFPYSPPLSIPNPSPVPSTHTLRAWRCCHPFPAAHSVPCVCPAKARPSPRQAFRSLNRDSGPFLKYLVRILLSFLKSARPRPPLPGQLEAPLRNNTIKFYLSAASADITPVFPC